MAPVSPPAPSLGSGSATPPSTAAQPSASAAPAPVPGAPEPFAGGVYPPPNFQPMHQRTAKPGDGEWQPLDWGKTAAGAAIHRAEVHPDKIKRHVFVTLIAFDRARIDLKLQAGTEEPATDAVGADRRTGLVPLEEQPRLLAVFNGGFMARHGNYGMMLDGAVYVPPKDDACAVGIGHDGDIVIASWPALEPKAASLWAWRQTPPCLVEQGAVNPRLAGELASRKWGAAQGGDRDIRRSALALDPSGRTLIYAFGDWVTATLLAEALHAAGAAHAAELDINWSYTRFFFMEQTAEGTPRIAESIVPKLEYSPKSYTQKPAARDFFYVLARPQRP